LIRSTKQLIL